MTPQELIGELYDAVENDDMYSRSYLVYAVEDLCTENEKLRELVKDMWQFTGTACKKYPRLFDQSAQGGQMVMPNAIEVFEQRMRELGVEV